MRWSARSGSGTVRRVTDNSGLNSAVVRVLCSERAACGITLAVLSQRSRVPLVTVQRVMAGVRPLRLDTLEALCAGLQVSPAVVLARAEQQTGTAP